MNDTGQANVVRIEVFSDYVCPFCWLAEPSLHELKRAEPNVEIVWKAYELRPDPVPTLDPQGEYLERVWNSSVYPLTEKLGMVMRLPPVQPRSRLAHEAAKWAAALERFDDYSAGVFRSFFERGENIGAVEVLVQIAVDLGMDAADLRRALEAREFEAGVLADERDAAELGISGVPAFVANRRVALSGVQSVTTLRALFDHMKQVKTSAAV